MRQKREKDSWGWRACSGSGDAIVKTYFLQTFMFTTRLSLTFALVNSTVMCRHNILRSRKLSDALEH